MSGFFFFLRFYLFIFREWGREGEREGEKHHVWLPLEQPLLGTRPTTQACALTANQTGNPLVCRPALNPLSHTSQGKTSVSKINTQLFLCLIRFLLLNFQILVVGRWHNVCFNRKGLFSFLKWTVRKDFSMFAWWRIKI